jgi:hypothetical protein
MKRIEQNNEFDIQKYFKEIDADIKSKLQSIPAGELEALLDRAFKDTKKLFKDDDNEDFKQVTYSIYRAYILGMLIGKIRSEETKINVIQKDNVYHINL